MNTTINTASYEKIEQDLMTLRREINKYSEEVLLRRIKSFLMAVRKDSSRFNDRETHYKNQLLSLIEIRHTSKSRVTLAVIDSKINVLLEVLDF